MREAPYDARNVPTKILILVQQAMLDVLDLGGELNPEELAAFPLNAAEIQRRRLLTYH